MNNSQIKEVMTMNSIFKNSKWFATLLVQLVFLFSIVGQATLVSASGAPTSIFYTENQQIKYSLNLGTPMPFYGKGIIYEPIPIGFSDGSTFVDVYHEQWRALYKRDIAIMRKMGINTIRIYGFFGYPPTYGQDKSIPSTSNLFNTLSDNYNHCINSTTGDPKSSQNDCTNYWNSAPWDHSEFLDELWNNGVDPIYVLVGIDNESVGSFLPNGTTAGGNAQPTTGVSGYLGYKNYVNFYTNLISWIGRKYGSHPAIMGFAMFNEKNDGRWDVGPFWDLINGYAKQIHNDSNLDGKLAGLALQTSAADVPNHMSNSYVLNSKVDFWGVNLYPISNYGDNYASYVTANPDKAKPLMITEYGALSVTHSPDVAGWPGCGKACPVGKEKTANEQKATTDIGKNYAKATNPAHPFFNGFYYFEYSDEWWKMKKSGTGKTIDNENTDHLWIHDLGTAAGGGESASGYWDEEWWGLLAVQRTGYDVSFDKNSYQNNQVAWIPGAAYYKTPPDYLIPRPQLAKLVQLYTGDKNKTLADIPTQNTFTLSNATSSTNIAALYGFEKTPASDKTYQATFDISPGKTAAVAMPANIQSFVIYNTNSWVPLCTNLASGISSHAGATLYVSEVSGDYTCGYTKPAPITVDCNDLATNYPASCAPIPGKNYGPGITYGCGHGVHCSLIATGGKYNSCSAAQKFGWVASQYYFLQTTKSASDCSFGGVGQYVGGH